jgi:AraC-like DNA-binding protein
MLDIYDVIVLGGAFCSFITSLILFTQGRFQLHANRLLSSMLFCFGWYAFIYLLFQTGWLQYVPAIYRIGGPLYYLIAPCAYLYVRGIIMDERRFRKWDWLHFLPAMLHFVDLIPFYVSDIETKRQAVMAAIRDFNTGYAKGSGFIIPAIWHFILRPLQGLIYLVLLWMLLTRSMSKKNYYNISADVFGRIKKWLFILTGFISILYLGLAIQTIIGFIRFDAGLPVVRVNGPTHVIMALAFFLLSVYLFFKPEILYGTLKTTLPGPVIKTDTALSIPVPLPVPEILPVAEPVQEEINAERKETLLNEELVSLHAKKIEEHLLVHQSFRKQGITITQLAVELSMPMHHLSYVLNFHYKQRFTDFISQYRVDYVRRLLKEEEWRKLKLETLATEAGFSSRSTFFSTFKKVTGLTPYDYARQADADYLLPGEQPHVASHQINL